jgi:hypothetical protein
MVHGIPVYMSRRGVARRRAELERSQKHAPRDRMARVQISPEMWAAFRAQLGATPVSVALGRLVERDVAKNLRKTTSDAEGARVALDDARLVADELAALITRLERADTALDSPGPDEEPAFGNDVAPVDDWR